MAAGTSPDGPHSPRRFWIFWADLRASRPLQVSRRMSRTNNESDDRSCSKWLKRGSLYEVDFSSFSFLGCFPVDIAGHDRACSGAASPACGGSGLERCSRRDCRDRPAPGRKRAAGIGLGAGLHRSGADTAGHHQSGQSSIRNTGLLALRELRVHADIHSRCRQQHLRRRGPERRNLHRRCAPHLGLDGQ